MGSVFNSSRFIRSFPFHGQTCFSGLLLYGPCWTSCLADELVVFRMATDPEPEHTFLDFNANRSIMETHSNSPIFSDLLEMQRRVKKICFE